MSSSRTPIRQLSRLDKQGRRRIVHFVETRLTSSGDPRQLGKPLRGNMAGLWSYRVGDHRLVCRLEVERKGIAVVSVAHRREVYR